MPWSLLNSKESFDDRWLKLNVDIHGSEADSQE